MRVRSLLLAAVLASSVPCDAVAQATAKLALDASKPIVYIEFDHAGHRTPVEEGEPATGLWLRLVNNSAFPIVVQANSTSTDPHMTILPDRIVPVHGKLPKSGASIQKMPQGYASDTGTPVVIEPGRDLVFSVPSDHVTKQWSMEVPFQFSLPSVKHGVQPTCLAQFDWGDIPTSGGLGVSHEGSHAQGTTR